ncbi:DUF885 domain-containing protein [Chitinimonas arctica]|uniref:DUF885 domain-containing protein n=1 Tax=Chitinimonas arctica TaxID=2594795 RepID=A0A516SM53_9NEIS|nr:DUF885 domain-containing protein [Chitinimonas arctica]QDQ29108.1 DUF885 domain-containing protein [Chitinimonas arctica]
MKKKAWLIAAGLTMAIGGAVANTVYFRPWSINTFFNRVSLTEGLDSPQILSDLRLFESWGLRGHNAKLDDISDAHEASKLARARRDLDTLLGYQRAKLSAEEQLSYDTMRIALTHQLAGEAFRYHDYPINQLWGEQLTLPNFLVNTHQISDLTDAEHYVARLRAIPAKLAQVRAKLAEREQRGIVAPHFALAKSLLGMSEFVAKPVEQNPLYLSFADKLSQSKDITVEQGQQQLALARDAIVQQVYPAYRQLIADTEALARSHHRDDGVWALPNGEAYYAWKLKGHTSTSLTPEQVHQLGLKEVARIEGEMRTILLAQGESATDVGAAMKKLGEDPRFQYSDNEAGRQKILDDYQRILQETQAALPKAFGHIPSATLTVKRIPAFGEKTAPGAYYEGPATDGSRPGVFFANLYDIKGSPRWSMRTLAFHEGVPGHHLQTAIAREQRDLPLFRRFTWHTAYGEGWALYAERLADEMGLAPDPYDKLGRLRDELFRATRLVVDTGLHAKRWTREQAVEYMQSHTGMTEGDVVIEIERYLVDPGQACAYKIGMLKILELRERAKTRLGEGFDLRRFHDLVLRSGPLPLSLLESQVDNWIAAGGKA